MSDLLIKSVEDFEINVKQYSKVWNNAQEIALQYSWAKKYPYQPNVHIRSLHSKENLYLRFEVEEKAILANAEKINDFVYTDSCVEFFCSPDLDKPDYYYNLEVNCAGVVFMCYGPPRRFGEREFISPDLLKGIKTSSTVVEKKKQISIDDKRWEMELCIPLSIFSSVSKNGLPINGDSWLANFFKCADGCPDLHYGSWQHIDLPGPDFHRPEFFGNIKFE